MARYPLRPRFRGLAWGSIGLGGLFAAAAWWSPPVVAAAAVSGLLFGGAYLLSPTWRLTVVADEHHLAVETKTASRFSLPWTEVQRVIASPTTKTCFVDGGSAARRIIIPGDGAPAPYRIERSHELYDWIIAHVPAEKVEHVGLLSERMS